jgi:uncharacterized protein
MSKLPALIVMAKEPRPGSTKTRLCPPLTPVEAAEIYAALLHDTLAWTTRLPDVQPCLAVTPSTGLNYFRRHAPPEVTLFPVDGPDIGAVLDRTLTRFLAAGHPAAIAVHSDGPAIPSQAVVDTVAGLDYADVVLGPSTDGGYYLIGLKQPCPGLFRGIPWSTGQVFSTTLARAAELGLTVQHLPPVADVDTFADLRRLALELRQWPADAFVYTRRALAGLNGLL